ncbi:hypothetical protein [Microbacterium sp. J1-1]|uniref:hypothetical protein n=1 Tax=Microbacterium sp. J1-1 TaxID=2992441 RepID=UPI00211475EB|nr:hypothetical protein [Microbacterium sp. J1-1]UUE19880.1 hypothetical protein LRQ07_13930 [Microbacterium sp. J1-1]
MTINTYNADKRYEMMAAILPDPKTENLPDAESILADLQKIIELCYIYTTDAGTAKELDASDLAEAIITYLFTEWAWKAPDLEAAARAHWGYPTQEVEYRLGTDGASD